MNGSVLSCVRVRIRHALQRCPALGGTSRAQGPATATTRRAIAWPELAQPKRFRLKDRVANETASTLAPPGDGWVQRLLIALDQARDISLRPARGARP